MQGPLFAKWTCDPPLISGPPIGDGNADDLPADGLPVWPERGVLTRMEADTFGALLAALSQVHWS
jgi:hypothetical protein